VVSSLCRFLVTRNGLFCHQSRNIAQVSFNKLAQLFFRTGLAPTASLALEVNHLVMKML